MHRGARRFERIFAEKKFLARRTDAEATHAREARSLPSRTAASGGSPPKQAAQNRPCFEEEETQTSPRGFHGSPLDQLLAVGVLNHVRSEASYTALAHFGE